MAFTANISLLQPNIVLSSNASQQGIDPLASDLNFGMVELTYPDCTVIAAGQYCCFPLDVATAFTSNDVQYYLLSVADIKFIEGPPA